MLVKVATGDTSITKQSTRKLCPFFMIYHTHWKLRVVMILTLSSLTAPEVVRKTTFGATSYDKVGIMTILSSQGSMCWNVNFMCGLSFIISTPAIHRPPLPVGRVHLRVYIWIIHSCPRKPASHQWIWYLGTAGNRFYRSHNTSDGWGQIWCHATIL